MDLFEVIPTNLFTILTSKNRSVYADSLLIMRKAFKENVLIDKEVLTNELINELHSNIFDIDVKADEDPNAATSYKDAVSLAKYIIKRLADTGWIDMEYESEDHLVEYVSLPPYSVHFINIIADLTNNEVKEYDSFMYAMYSSLLNADGEYKDYRYTALNSVYEKMLEFEDSLKTLFHNLKRHYTNLVSLKTVNQILSEHFDSYQKDVIMQIYLPLKTKDSITRFKGSIFTILMKWMRDADIIDSMAGQALVQAKYPDVDSAHAGILSKINYIVDKLTDLEELVDLIDKRNTTYVSAATDKMSHLLNNDKSISGKLTKIMAKVATDLQNGYESSLDVTMEVLQLQKQQVLSGESLFTRAQGNFETDDSGPGELTYVDDEVANKLTEAFESETRNRFSHQNVINFMKEQLNDKESVNSNELQLSSIDDMILLMNAFMDAYDDKLFYRMKLEHGQVINNDYQIPNLVFSKRRN
ncbi:MAG: Wadjet anti-phage system protein JetA family protein [Bacilli bacterium]|nr:DUF5716 family protein [Bacilli bacterium]MDD3422246.1 DUF5716 family protein [Bacilli bacterium]MDD4065561.1 DUF5716 family protein [Bacilli bacterium]